jgi:hypothetical protein
MTGCNFNFLDLPFRSDDNVQHDGSLDSGLVGQTWIAGYVHRSNLTFGRLCGRKQRL